MFLSDSQIVAYLAREHLEKTLHQAETDRLIRMTRASEKRAHGLRSLLSRLRAFLTGRSSQNPIKADYGAAK